MSMPPPPPGFELVVSPSGPPPPPPGFQLVDAQPQPTTADSVWDAGQQLVRGLNRGVNSIVSLPNEIFAGAVNLIAPGQGDRFKWDNPVSRFMSSPEAKPQTELGRYADQVGQAVGASSIPMMGMAAKATQAVMPAVAPAATAMGRIGQQSGQIGQQLVNSYRTAPGAAVAADVAAAAGSGVGQQMAQDGGFGPVGQMVGGVVGGMAPNAIAGAASGTVRQVQRARANMGEQGAYGRIVDQLPGGVAPLADDIAVGATGGNLGNNRRALDILGEEMTRANGNVAVAQQAAIARIAQEAGITPQTAAQHLRRLSNVHRGSQLMLGEYPAVARSDAAQRTRQAGNVDLDELGRVQSSTTQGQLDYLANNGNAQSAQHVRNAIARRQEDLSPAVADSLLQSGPQAQVGPRTTRPATIGDVEAMVANADNLAAQEYRAAYQGPINNQMMLQTLPRLLQWHERRAAGRAGEIANAINRATGQFYIDTPNGRVAMMTLQQLQDARGAVRGQITEYRRAGRDDLVRAVQPVYQQITRLMGQMSPQWARANARWADNRLQDVAAELGEAFAKNAGPRFREQMREFDRMAPEAQNVVRVYWIQQQLDRLQNAGDSASLSRFFANDHMRNMARQLLGDQAAIGFTRMIRDLKVAEQSQRMMGNSATHRRGVAQRQEDAETGLNTARELASPGGMRNWLFERAIQAATENRNRPMASVLTTPMSETAQVAMHLHRMQQQQNRLLQFAQPMLLPPAWAGQIAPAVNPTVPEYVIGR